MKSQSQASLFPEMQQDRLQSNLASQIQLSMLATPVKHEELESIKIICLWLAWVQTLKSLLLAIATSNLTEWDVVWRISADQGNIRESGKKVN